MNGGWILDGLHLTVFSSGVLFLEGRKREITKADVDAIREMVKAEGLVITKEWIPTVGMSWLSSGVAAGVSFQTQARECPDGGRCNHGCPSDPNEVPCFRTLWCAPFSAYNDGDGWKEGDR